MSAVKARIHVGEDHAISGAAPDEVPPGEHEVVITLKERAPPLKFFKVADLPRNDLIWDDSISLRREDMYGDDGR